MTLTPLLNANVGMKVGIKKKFQPPGKPGTYNKSNKKPPKRVYVCGTKCKAQKKKIAKTKGYPFNVWRQTEKKISPWNLKNALKAFDNVYNREKLLRAKWRIARMPAKNRRKRVRKTKAKA